MKVQNSKYTAGVLAYDYYATTITDCSNSGAVSYNGRGQDSLSVWVSGIICYSNKALTIARCTNEGALHARNWAQTGANNYIGGIYGGGYATASSITDCTTTGEITVESTAKVVIGGITGSLQGNITGVTQDGDICATGSGLCMVGGIVGYHHNGNIGASAANNCSVSGTFETTCGSTCRTGGISGISHDNKAPLASTWSYITIDALVVGNEGYKGALSGGISSVAGEDHALAITLSNNTYTGTKVNGNDINADNICGSIGTGSFSGFVAP